jgi:hypothetical protein
MSVSARQVQLVDPSGAANARTVQSAVVDGRTLELRVGDLDSVQYIWTRLTDAQDDDVIWIERTTDGGHTWKDFARRTITGASGDYTDALRTDPSPQVRMKALTALNNGNEYQTSAF